MTKPISVERPGKIGITFQARLHLRQDNFVVASDRQAARRAVHLTQVSELRPARKLNVHSEAVASQRRQGRQGISCTGPVLAVGATDHAQAATLLAATQIQRRA